MAEDEIVVVCTSLIFLSSGAASVGWCHGRC